MVPISGTAHHLCIFVTVNLWNQGFREITSEFVKGLKQKLGLGFIRCQSSHFMNSAVISRNPWVHRFTVTYMLSVCLSVCVYLCMYVSLPVCLYVPLSLCVYVCQSVCLCVCLYVCVYVCQSICLSVCVYVCMSVCMSVNQSGCLSVCVQLQWVLWLSLVLNVMNYCPVFLSCSNGLSDTLTHVFVVITGRPAGLAHLSVCSKRSAGRRNQSADWQGRMLQAFTQVVG